MADTIRVPIFSGKKEDWDIWSFRFQAFCDAHDLGNVLRNDNHGLPEHRKKVRSWLALAMQSAVCINIIRNIPTDDVECGTVAWIKLREHFENSSAARKVSLMGQLQSSQRAQESAAEFLTRLEGIAADLEAIGVKIPGETLARNVIVGLRPEYGTVVQLLLSRDDFSLDSVRRAISTNCVFIEQQAEYQSHGSKREVAFHAGNSDKRGNDMSFVGRPRGPCWNCGGPHLRRFCPKLQHQQRNQQRQPPHGSGHNASMATYSDSDAYYDNPIAFMVTDFHKPSANVQHMSNV